MPAIAGAWLVGRVRALICVLVLGAACNDVGLATADLSTASDLAVADLRAAPDLATSCTLATVYTDCAASCGTPDGGLVAHWPCMPDPICSGDHWLFGCQ